MADRLGVNFDNTPLLPIVLADADGIPHTFQVRSMLMATGREMEALEMTGDDQLGYCFRVLGESDAKAWDLFRQLYDNMRRDMARRHVEQTELGWQLTSDHRLIGRIEWDPNTNGALPVVVIDGKPFTWEQVGHMLMMFEGFTIDARIEDTVHVVGKPV